MLKLIITLLSLIITLIVNGQVNPKLSMIICLNGKDTLTIEKYKLGKRHFLKSYLYNGKCNITVYDYKGNFLRKYISHLTNERFSIENTIKEKSTNRRLTYSYEMRPKINDSDKFCQINNANEILKSKIFKSTFKKKYRYLKKIVSFDGSFIKSEIIFKNNGDTISFTNYQIEKNLIKRIETIHFNEKNGRDYIFEEVYSYDSANNEKQCLWIRNKSDTISIVNKKYQNNLLIEEEFIRDKKFDSITKYEYKNNNLVKKIENIGKYETPSITEYKYNEDNTIKTIADSNGWTYHYFY